MNNLLSYCGLVDAKIRAFDKDLPVTNTSVGTFPSYAYIIVLVCQMASIASVPIEASYDGSVYITIIITVSHKVVLKTAFSRRDLYIANKIAPGQWLSF